MLARPTVYTLNNRWAAISTGQRIAVPSSTLSTVDPDNFNQAVRSSISFEEVLLQVRVLPLINSDDQVTLQIEQNNDDIVGSQNISGNDIPTIGTQQLYTTVIVPDGGTVLLGGLISEDDRKTDTGLPVFVGLPLVGPLFGNADREKSRQELLIFIQPKIVETEVDLANAQADVAARSELADEALGFAAPKVTAEVKSRGGLLRRLLGGRRKRRRGRSFSRGRWSCGRWWRSKFVNPGDARESILLIWLKAGPGTFGDQRRVEESHDFGSLSLRATDDRDR